MLIPERYYSKAISRLGGRKVFYTCVIWALCFVALLVERLDPNNFTAITIAALSLLVTGNVATKFAKRPGKKPKVTRPSKTEASEDPDVYDRAG